MSVKRRDEAQPNLTRRGRETRTRIVSEAARLMFEHGAALTTLDDVRSAAKVSSSQIYHYFSNKEELVRAVVEHQNEEIVSVHEAIFANLDTVAGLRAWRDFVVKHQRGVHCKGGCPIGTLSSEVAETDPIARALAADGFRRWEAGIRAGFEAMCTNGTLPAGTDASVLAAATLAGLQGGLLLTQVQRSTAALEAILDTLIAHVERLAADSRRLAKLE